MQGNIIDKAIELYGGKKSAFLAYFNERMGMYAITRQTLYQWRREVCKPDPRILGEALRVYPLDDPRYLLAHELIDLQSAKLAGVTGQPARE